MPLVWGTVSSSVTSPTGLVNLTGYTADMQFRVSPYATSILYEASTANGAIVLGGATGTITITIPAVTTTGFTFRQAVYDLKMTSPGGVVTRLLAGSVTVSPEVTR